MRNLRSQAFNLLVLHDLLDGCHAHDICGRQGRLRDVVLLNAHTFLESLQLLQKTARNVQAKMSPAVHDSIWRAEDLLKSINNNNDATYSELLDPASTFWSRLRGLLAEITNLVR